VVATELEFYLVDPARPRPTPPASPRTGLRVGDDHVLAVDQLETFAAFLEDVQQAAEALDVPAETAISENGAGQFEINLGHFADALRAGDDALQFKRVVKGVARRHDLAATFMAKPYGGRSGSGLHVHVSLLDGDGRNVFDDGSRQGSALLQSAVAGLIDVMPETMLLFAPHLNSFRRLRPGTHAPVAAAWGYENRTTAIRIPGGASAARRIEHRLAGADANPYLVLAGVLGGALIGIEQARTPPDPVRGNAYAQDLPPLPRDWTSAVDLFAAGARAEEIVGPMARRMLVACKRQEIETFARHVTGFEARAYLETV
jgi:glutamine synthetase